jgi:putative hydrolase of HD superfamily
MSNDERLHRQISFLLEIDKLKSVYRRSYLLNRSRHENDAEHSWHLAVMAMILLEHADNPELDLLTVMKMLLVHDLVEIYAGDTFAYDEQGHADKAERERIAANRLFGMLPDDQRAELMSLWEQFEAGITPEAKFAAAIDRLEPLLLNYHTEGKSWREHGVRSGQVLSRNRLIDDSSPALWEYVQSMIEDAVKRGYLES